MTSFIHHGFVFIYSIQQQIELKPLAMFYLFCWTSLIKVGNTELKDEFTIF